MIFIVESRLTSFKFRLTSSQRTPPSAGLHSIYLSGDLSHRMFPGIGSRSIAGSASIRRRVLEDAARLEPALGGRVTPERGTLGSRSCRCSMLLLVHRRRSRR